MHMGNTKLFEDPLIAPCGMNCGICIALQFAKYDLNKRGYHRRYCPGCRPRGKNCTFVASYCELMKDGLVRFCYECERFPCERLKRLDKRYSTKYGMSMIGNLNYIKKHDLDPFLSAQEKRWRCKVCGEATCCHTHSCLNCNDDLSTYRKPNT